MMRSLYTSEKAAVAAVRELGVGWTILACDTPERGLLGYLAVRGAEDRLFEWAIFGQPLEPDVQRVEGLELVTFLQDEPADAVCLCDDPRARLLGFVSYRRAASGKAEVRQTTIPEIKGLKKDPRAILMKAREDRRHVEEARRAAARAIQPYGPVRAWFARALRRFGELVRRTSPLGT